MIWLAVYKLYISIYLHELLLMHSTVFDGTERTCVQLLIWILLPSSLSGNAIICTKKRKCLLLTVPTYIFFK